MRVYLHRKRIAPIHITALVMEFWTTVVDILIHAEKQYRFDCDTLDAWRPNEFNPDNAFDYVISQTGPIPNEAVYRSIFRTHWKVILSTAYTLKYPHAFSV